MQVEMLGKELGDDRESDSDPREQANQGWMSTEELQLWE